MLHEADNELFLSILVSSDGDAPLTAERYDKIVGNERGTTKDYAVDAKIAGLDIQTADALSAKFRTLLVVKLYKLVVDVGNQLSCTISDLKPSELAKTYTSLTTSFATMTAPAAKVSFDYESEIKRLAEEFELPVEQIKGDFKTMETRLKAVK